MRFTTLASIGLIAASTAALAQVAATPDEQKVPAAGANTMGNDMAVPSGSNTAAPMSDTSETSDAAANAASPAGNDMAPATPPTERKTTPRRR